MNVIITNEQQAVVAGLDIDVIKSLNGQFDVDELISMFQNFYFGKMILDVTAIKDYKNLSNFQKLSMSLEVDKIILLLPPTDPDSTSNGFLSQLISMGFYNFTTNLEGLQYLYSHPNSYRDVAHIHQLGQIQPAMMTSPTMSGGDTIIMMNSTVILGVKNLTDHTGATTLIYMLKQTLESHGRSVAAIELNKRDFQYFQEKDMYSSNADQFPTEVMKHQDKNIILVDLNDSNQEEACTDVIYLLSPSTIRLNKLMKRDRRIFEKMRGKKIVLCQSMLNQTDINDLEYESKAKFFYNLPPLNERIKNSILTDFLAKLGLLETPSESDGGHAGGLFNLFRGNNE